MNCIICAIAKNENQYLYEWASYHLGIGFDHIHIYDNNDEDGERIKDVFYGTELENKITIHDVRGKVKMQLPAYQDCYDKEEFDWCAFIDIDEFVTFTDSNLTITKFLSDKSEFDAVHLNWKCYGDSGHVRKKEGGVRERIKNPILPIDFVSEYLTIPENAHVKSIIRKGLDVNWNDMIDSQLFEFLGQQPHTAPGINKICNSEGLPVLHLPWNPINYKHAYISHYVTKTIEEYVVKANRTDGMTGRIGGHSFSRFFKYNKITIRKLLFVLSKGASVWIILRESFLWWNLKHKTIIAKYSKKYKRMITEEKPFVRRVFDI